MDNEYEPYEPYVYHVTLLVTRFSKKKYIYFPKLPLAFPVCKRYEEAMNL